MTTSTLSVTSSIIVSNGVTLDVLNGGVLSSGSVLNGGTVVLSGTGMDSGTTISAGGVELISSGGSAFGDQIYGQQTLSHTATVTSETVYNGGTLFLAGGAGGSFANAVTVLSGGLLALTGSATASNTVVNGGTVELESAKATLSGSLTFSGTGGDLYISGATTSFTSAPGFGPEATVYGFQAGDVVDLAAAVYASSTAVSFTSAAGGNVTTATVASATGSAFTLLFSGTPLAALTTVVNGGDELIESVACYVRGTAIDTVTEAMEAGEAAVEDLTIGDLVATVGGTPRPVKWIGRRSYAGRFLASNPDVVPVVIRAGALADGVPRRDLMVSPLHAMFIDGMLIAARDLVNGVTIAPATGLDLVEYFHIEFETHDVIFAEGAPAESFVDDDSRMMFANAAEYVENHPDAARPALYCAPRVRDGYALEAVRQRLGERAGVRAAVAPAPLRGFVDEVAGGLVQGWAQNPERPEVPVCLDIVADGRLVAQVLADRYRGDLAAAGLGSGRHAFLARLPAECQWRAVVVRRSVDGAALPAVERDARAA